MRTKYYRKHLLNRARFRELCHFVSFYVNGEEGYPLQELKQLPTAPTEAFIRREIELIYKNI